MADTGDKVLDYLNFMASRYVPGKRKGDDVLELYTTDTGKTYRVSINESDCKVNSGDERQFSARIETTSDAFVQFTEGKLNVVSALLKKLVRVKGDINLIKNLPRYFNLAE